MKKNIEDRTRRIRILFERYQEQKHQKNHIGAEDTLIEMKKEEDAIKAGDY